MVNTLEVANNKKNMNTVKFMQYIEPHTGFSKNGDKINVVTDYYSKRELKSLFNSYLKRDINKLTNTMKERIFN